MESVRVNQGKSLSEKVREAVFHMSVYGLGAACQALLGFVLIPLYTKYYNTETYGVLSLLQLLGTIAGVIFYFGASSALSRSYYDYEDLDGRQNVMSTSLYISTIGAITQIVLGLLFGEKLSLLLFHTTEYASGVTIVFISSAFAFTNGLFYLILRFERKSVQVILMNIFTLLMGASLILFALTVLHIGLMAPVIGEAVNQILCCVVLFMLTRKSFKLVFSPSEAMVQLKYGIPTAVAGLAYYLLSGIDRFCINKFGLLGDVGIYSLGCKIGSLINILFILPFAQIWAPMRMQYLRDANSNELYKVILTYYFLAGCLLVVGVSLFAEEMLTIFSARAEYRKAHFVVPIIMAAHLIYGAINIIDLGIAISRKPIYNIYTFGIALMINITLNVSLIPRYGYIAAAWVTLGSFVILALMTYLVSVRLYHIRYEITRLIWIAGTAASVLVIAFSVQVQRTGPFIFMKACLLLLLPLTWYKYVLTVSERAQLVRIIGTGWRNVTEG